MLSLRAPEWSKAHSTEHTHGPCSEERLWETALTPKEGREKCKEELGLWISLIQTSFCPCPTNETHNYKGDVVDEVPLG